MMIIRRIVALIVALGCIGATNGVSESDRLYFAQGEALQRVIFMFQDAKMCAPVLLRSRCVGDVQTYQALFGASGAMSQKIQVFANSGNIDDFDSAWSSANAVVLPDPLWQAAPRATWLRAGGVAVETSYSPVASFLEMTEAPLYAAMTKYASDASPFSDSFNGQRASASAIVPALRQAFPAQPYPVLELGDGLRGTMQLGVYVGTALEMFDVPTLALSPASRAFLSAVASRMEAEMPDASKPHQIPDLATSFLTVNGPNEWKAARIQWSQLSSAFAASMRDQRPRRDAFLYGLMAAQLAYNAANTRQIEPLRQQLAVLRAFTGPDALASQLAQKRAAIFTVPAGDWKALNRAATDLTLAIVAN